MINLVNMIFGQHDLFPEPKVALTKDLVYIVICKSLIQFLLNIGSALGLPVLLVLDVFVKMMQDVINEFGTDDDVS